ncbi:hypothetical protein [Singulisphaera acidiphila]|uniref:hypothetical protein n=1 Tax=Singulisphaera acidiphila TaxID=466153 RepID=UPI0012F8F3E0|nr:hypothetical protein [Singulisphaera acidiphila]
MKVHSVEVGVKYWVVEMYWPFVLNPLGMGAGPICPARSIRQTGDRWSELGHKAASCDRHSRANSSGSEGESPVYPIVVALRWERDGE